MNSSLICVHPATPYNVEDAELGARLGVALVQQQRTGWRDIHVVVRSGVVTVSGNVLTNRDRQSVIAIVLSEAPEALIEDEVSVVCLSDRRANSDLKVLSQLLEKRRAGLVPVSSLATTESRS